MRTAPPRRHREPTTLLLLMLVAALTWVFFEVADRVGEGSASRLDERAIMALRSPADVGDPLGPSWIEEVMRDLTALGGYAVITTLVLAVLSCLSIQRRWNLVLLIAASVLGAMIASSLLKSHFDRPRPDLMLTAISTSSVGRTALASTPRACPVLTR